jgi:hypothetical protein
MRDRHLVWLGLALLLATTLACNAFAGGSGSSLPPAPTLPATPGATTPGAATPPPDAGPPGIAPTVTLPGEVATAAAQGTLVVLVKLNVRTGPGVAYERVGSLLPDDTAAVLGRDEASGWWRIVCPPDMASGECWVSGDSRYTRAVNAAAAPTAAVPATLTVQPIEQP